jgi:hypothetical protein
MTLAEILSQEARDLERCACRRCQAQSQVLFQAAKAARDRDALLMMLKLVYPVLSPRDIGEDVFREVEQVIREAET